jgi:hypothetical protein
MHSWVDISKKFIGILTRLRDAYGLGRGAKTACKIQLNDFTPKDKELILEILRFIRLLMENSTSRKLFDGYDVGQTHALALTPGYQRPAPDERHGRARGRTLRPSPPLAAVLDTDAHHPRAG